MRIIVFNPFLKKEKFYKKFIFFSKYIEKLKKKKIVFCDFTNEIDDFEYHCFVRNYQIAFVFYDEILKYKYISPLKCLRKNNKNIDIYLLIDNKNIKNTELKNELKKKFSIKEIELNDDKRNETIDEIFISKIENRMLTIPSEFEFDFEERKAFFIKNSKKILLPFTKKLDFSVMYCFVLNKNVLLTIDEISNFCSISPEEVNNLVIENSILSIRKLLKKMNLLSEMDIVSKKKVGYIFCSK